MEPTSLPVEVHAAYFPGEVTSIRQLGHGMVNLTLYVKTNRQQLVLQRLAPTFSAAVVEDYAVIASHLRSDGWNVPSIVRTLEGRLSFVDRSGRSWRAQEYISSDPPAMENIVDIQDSGSYGHLLGRLHTSLSNLPYRPTFMIPHFHDAHYDADALAKAIPALPGPDAKTFAQTLLATYEALPNLPAGKRQLIHGDPRTANILLQDGKPYTFIDWDTVMLGSVWTDLGDMLRSVAENAVAANKPVPVSSILAIAEAYRQETQPDEDQVSFYRCALDAARNLAIELAMRFMADYQDGADGYFSWDPSQYSSRQAYTSERARLQWSIYRQLTDSTT